MRALITRSLHANISSISNAPTDSCRCTCLYIPSLIAATSGPCSCCLTAEFTKLVRWRYHIYRHYTEKYEFCNPDFPASAGKHRMFFKTTDQLIENDE